MIPADLFTYAYIPAWFEQLYELSQLAAPEPWRYTHPEYETQNNETPILERYINQVFRKQAVEYNYARPEYAERAFYRRNEFSCFHTGLYTPQYKGIYMCFDRNKKRDTLKQWYFRGFVDESSERLRYVQPLPQRPAFPMRQKMAFYNPDWEIRVNTEHILGDASNAARLPAPIRDSWNLPLLLESAVELARRKARMDWSLAVPQVFQSRIDVCSYRAHQLMYWPTTPANGEYVFERFKGHWLNPDEYLAAHPEWKDCTQLPTSSRESTLIDRQRKQQADPLAKPGLIGAFCRAYSIENAIDTFLPDVYQPSAMSGRYDYVPADSSAGVVLYDGKFAYSHHASDPACGQLLNAFDVVRLHKFGHLDAANSETADPTKLPSFKAMQDFALQDDAVKETLSKERMVQAAQDFANPEDWQKLLELDRQGHVKDTLTNIANIVRFDENLQSIVFNELTGMLDVTGALPWRQVKPGWGDADLACAKVYFEQVYGIWSPTKFKDALLAVVSAERVYHPIKEYFDTLSWDGVERVDMLLIDYLGADDTPYTRAVTRKTLCAAVARVYDPGVKFDSILVLNGPQGVGKSTLFARLGGKWFSDSLTISDMKDKTAAEKLQGYWILELGELAGIRKVDVETVKSFISRTDDKFRQSYGATVESHPRNSIIVGSTNSESGFLRDITGNRRFWPVHVAGGSRHTVFELTQPIIDQLWAEAIAKYRDGEKLYLTGEVAAQAYVQQQEAMESDDREGIISDYLETLLPTNWDSMQKLTLSMTRSTG